jgi:hypothetical protein
MFDADRPAPSRWRVLLGAPVWLPALAVGLYLAYRAMPALMIVPIQSNVSNLGEITTMLHKYDSRHGQYPPKLDSLAEINRELPWLNRLNLRRNSWGRAYIYRTDGRHFEMVSPGLLGSHYFRRIPWNYEVKPTDARTCLIVSDTRKYELGVVREQGGP